MEDLVQEELAAVVGAWLADCQADRLLRPEDAVAAPEQVARALVRAIGRPQPVDAGVDREFMREADLLSQGIRIAALTVQLLYLRSELLAVFRGKVGTDVQVELADRSAVLVGWTVSINAVSVAEALDRRGSRNPVTALLGQKAFQSDLERDLAEGRWARAELNVIAVDVDGLKAVNDGPGGHIAGDALLKDVALGLSEGIEKSDSPYHIHGDEYVVILRGKTLDQAQTLMKQIRDAAPPFSLGVLNLAETTEPDVTQLYRLADERMYIEKKARRAARSQPGQVTDGVLP